MPSPIQLIAVDLDGTLLSHEGQVGPRNRAAITLAHQAGVEFAVATGRRHCYAMRVLRDLPLHPESILISSNGAVVRTFASTLIERTQVDPQAARQLVHDLAGFRDALVITFDKVLPSGEDERGALVVEQLANLHDSIGKWMTANEPYILQVDPIEQSLLGEPPIQLMLCGTIDRMRRAEAHMAAHGVQSVAEPGTAPAATQSSLTLARTEYPDRDLSLVDILPAGCSKGAALLRLAASRNIQPSEVMAIGDNWNDLSMLEAVGHPVLMQNAPEDLKQYARTKGWTIGQPHHLDGVAEAIEAALTVGYVR